MWEIQSFISVGPISFGATRKDIHTELGSGFRLFCKVKGENLSDAYQSLGLHLFFDDDDKLELVEGFSPANICFDGVLLLGCSAIDVVEELRRKGHEGHLDDIGHAYNDLGFALTVDNNIVEGVAVFCS